MAVAGMDASRVRVSPSRSVRSWATPPTTPGAYTPLIQVDWHGGGDGDGPPSTNSSPGTARGAASSCWYTPQLPSRISRTSTHSRSFTHYRTTHPHSSSSGAGSRSAAYTASHHRAHRQASSPSRLQIPLDLHGKHSPKRGSADSLVEAVSTTSQVAHIPQHVRDQVSNVLGWITMVWGP